MRRSALLAACAAMLVPAASARADTVTQWNLNATNALLVSAGQAPQVSVQHLAMVHGAVYDAVNAIDGGHEGYLIPAGSASPADSKEAAAATAAHHVLPHLVPAQQATLDGLYADSLAGLPDGPAKTGGITVGEQAAAAMIAARPPDGGPFRVRRRLGARRLEAGAAGVRQRSERLAQGPEAVPDR